MLISIITWGCFYLESVSKTRSLGRADNSKSINGASLRAFDSCYWILELAVAPGIPSKDIWPRTGAARPFSLVELVLVRLMYISIHRTANTQSAVLFWNSYCVFLCGVAGTTEVTLKHRHTHRHLNRKCFAVTTVARHLLLLLSGLSHSG